MFSPTNENKPTTESTSINYVSNAEKTGTSTKSTGCSSKEFDAYKQICASLLMDKNLQSSYSVFSQQTRSGIFVHLATQSATDAHY